MITKAYCVDCIYPLIGEDYSDSYLHFDSFTTFPDNNNIGHEGCATLSRGLQKCRELKTLE